MWLKLDIRGMKIELQINGYQRSDKDNWDCQWCNVSFSFEFPGCIDYSKMNDEIILSCEVETLERIIDDFINDRITDKETLELMNRILYLFSSQVIICLNQVNIHMLLPDMKCQMRSWNGK